MSGGKQRGLVEGSGGQVARSGWRNLLGTGDAPRATRFSRLVILLAAMWAIGVSMYLFFAPQTIHSVTAVQVAGEPAAVEAVTKERSWYQVQGLWGSLVLLIFAVYYIVPLRFAWQSRYAPLLLMGGIGLLLSYLTGFSIGLLYLPAALALLTSALLLMLLARR